VCCAPSVRRFHACRRPCPNYRISRRTSKEQSLALPHTFTPPPSDRSRRLIDHTPLLRDPSPTAETRPTTINGIYPPTPPRKPLPHQYLIFGRALCAPVANRRVHRLAAFSPSLPLPERAPPNMRGPSQGSFYAQKESRVNEPAPKLLDETHRQRFGVGPCPTTSNPRFALHGVTTTWTLLTSKPAIDAPSPTTSRESLRQTDTVDGSPPCKPFLRRGRTASRRSRTKEGSQQPVKMAPGQVA